MATVSRIMPPCPAVITIMPAVGGPSRTTVHSSGVKAAFVVMPCSLAHPVTDSSITSASHAHPHGPCQTGWPAAGGRAMEKTAGAVSGARQRRSPWIAAKGSGAEAAGPRRAAQQFPQEENMASTQLRSGALQTTVTDTGVGNILDGQVTGLDVLDPTEKNERTSLL